MFYGLGLDSIGEAFWCGSSSHPRGIVMVVVEVSGHEKPEGIDRDLQVLLDNPYRTDEGYSSG